MKRKIISTLLCCSMVATIMAGCKDKETKKEDSKAGQTTETEAKTDEKKDKKVDYSKRAEGTTLLSIEFSDEEVLEAPEGACLFADKLSLPISVEDLGKYYIRQNGKNHTLSEEFETSTQKEAFEEREFLYRSLSDDETCIMEMYIGKNDCDMTKKESVDASVWSLYDGISSNGEALGMTQDEMREAIDKTGLDCEEAYIKILQDKFGKPNFVSFRLNGVEDAVDQFVEPEITEIGISTCNYIIGWNFEEYRIYVVVSETSRLDNEGNYESFIHTDASSPVGLFYYPAEFPNIEDEYIVGENQLAEFEKYREEKFGK